MKKLILIFAVTLFSLSVKAQTRYNIYQDSVGQVHVSSLPQPMVAIWGNFSNLLSIPTTIAGYGITDAIGSSSAINTLSKTASYTIVSGDISTSKQPVIYLSVDCTSGSNTQTLPSATTYAGYKIIVTKTDATANTITVSGVSLDNIIGIKGSSKEFIVMNSNWVNN